MVLDPKQFWRTASATRMSVVVDADDYFRHARSAMLKARRRIMLIGWDFDARIQLANHPRVEGEPAQLGDFIHWLAERNSDLEVYLLRWDMGAVKTLMRRSNLRNIIRWMRHPRIHTKLDSFHPTGASHHQKIVVIDDCVAFCGGIDMTCQRWDTREHKDNEKRRHVGRKPYGPWHDATTALEGPVAAALGKLARDRWKRAGGMPLRALKTDSDCWPDDLVPQFSGVEVGIARTRPKMPGCREVREIEELFVSQIRAAKTSIYAESQYFASRRIAEAIAARLAEKNGPEIVIINPLTAEGWLEPVAMDTARARLVAALKDRDTYDRFRIYIPRTAKGQPIYVHAKVMIVDGRTLRIGSANMNNRSLGLDTECDVTISGTGKNGQTITAIRDDLIAKHLGVSADRVSAQIERQGSLIAAIEHLRRRGRSLQPYRVPELLEVTAWLADNEILDPENPSEMFEVMTNRGLFRRLRRPRPAS
jgi:phosphatidylserine/phosphatidylglycerophosphate/cardiolipin synthase-like enzyme